MNKYIVPSRTHPRHVFVADIISTLAYEGGAAPDSNSVAGKQSINVRSWQLHALKILSAQIVLTLMESVHHKQGR